MTIPAFASGLLLGLSIAAPVGAMGLLCITRTLQRGLLAGLSVGAGIATGDAAYGALAAFGFAAATDLLVSHATPIRLVGGAFLIWMGTQSWRMAARPKPIRATASESSLGRNYVVAIGLTLTNPATILSFIAAFGALDLAKSHDGAAWLVAGVFLGSAFWWLMLCTIVAKAGYALPPSAMAWIDRGSAVILVAFGLAAIVAVL